MNLEHLDDPEGFVPDEAFRVAAKDGGRRQRRRQRFALAGGSVLCSLLLVVVALGGYGWWRTSRIDRVPVDFATQPVDLGAPFNVLLIGSDERDGGSAAVEGDRSEAAMARSDTMIVVRVEPSERRVVLLSLPRDLVLRPEDGAEGRLNAAFATGGPAGLVRAVESQLGVALAAYVEIGFSGVVDLVDAVGGLPVSVSEQLQDRQTGLHLDQSACTELDGLSTLALLRSRQLEVRDESGGWRHDPSSDLGRITRQRAVLAVLLPRLGQLADSLGGIDAALSVLDEHVTVDSRFQVGTLLQLARWATDGPAPSLEEVSLPVAGATTTSGARVLVLAPGAASVVARMGGTLPATTVAVAEPAADGSGVISEAVGVVPIGPCR